MIENLEKLLNTLNMIEVKGAANLSHLLGCIQLVQQMYSEQSKNETTQEG